MRQNREVGLTALSSTDFVEGYRVKKVKKGFVVKKNKKTISPILKQEADVYFAISEYRKNEARARVETKRALRERFAPFASSAGRKRLNA
jgi:hypothetical protein